jgi:uncharacterized membrane protein
MSGETQKRLTAVISAVLAIAVGWAIVAGNIIVPLIAIALAAGITYYLRKKTKDVMQDERTALLYGKASVATIRICIPLAALAGLVIFTFRDRLSDELVTAGYVLAYFARVLMLVQLAFYSYFDRKH